MKRHIALAVSPCFCPLSAAGSTLRMVVVVTPNKSLIIMTFKSVRFVRFPFGTACLKHPLCPQEPLERFPCFSKILYSVCHIHLRFLLSFCAVIMPFMFLLATKRSWNFVNQRLHAATTKFQSSYQPDIGSRGTKLCRPKHDYTTLFPRRRCIFSKLEVLKFGS